MGKLSRDENMELNDSLVKHKEWTKYWQHNAKAGAVTVRAQKSEVILALEEANELELTWPSGTAPNMLNLN